MSFKDLPPLGQALLAIGGVFLAGAVIAEITDTEPPREARKSTSRKKKPTLSSKEIVRSPRKRYIVELPPPRQISVSRSGTSESGEQKYPDHYYTLSKSQQYKYRQRMAKELFEISKEL